MHTCSSYRTVPILSTFSNDLKGQLMEITFDCGISMSFLIADEEEDKEGLLRKYVEQAKNGNCLGTVGVSPVSSLHP